MTRPCPQKAPLLDWPCRLDAGHSGEHECSGIREERASRRRVERVPGVHRWRTGQMPRFVVDEVGAEV